MDNVRIMIVDDSMVARRDIRRHLEPLGLAVAEYGSGEALLQALRYEGKPLMVFMDVVMPGIGGIEALRQVNLQYPDLPVVMLSADVQKHTCKAIRSLGNYPVVAKPLDNQAIRDLVSRARSS